LPAAVHTHCAVTGNVDGTLGCTSIGTMDPVTIAPGLALLFPGPQGWLRYQVRAAHAPATEPAVAEARVRFVGEAELIGLLKVGDVDGSAYAAAAGRHATLTSVGESRPAAPGVRAGSASGVIIASRMVDASVRIPVDRAGSAWKYMNRVVKAGV